MDEPLSFTAVDSFDIKGRGTCYIGRYPQEWPADLSDAIGREVVINGEARTIRGVERHPTVNQIEKPGSMISILPDRPISQTIRMKP